MFPSVNGDCVDGFDSRARNRSMTKVVVCVNI
nr:MAG TPA: hypothetical protein [Siphoviridae sp. ctcOR4]